MNVVRFLKYFAAVAAVLVGLVMALLAYSYHHDQENFRAAKNACERGCIQDSGGIEQCRPICADHPDRYP